MTTMRPQVHSSEPTTPTPSPMGTTPALSRRERRGQRFFARRLSRLSLEDDDPIERQILQLLRQARSIQTPASCSSTLPRLIHLLILMLSLASSATANLNHQPFNWTLSLWQFEKLLAFNVTAGAPSFTLHVCRLAGYDHTDTKISSSVINTFNMGYISNKLPPRPKCSGTPSSGLTGPYGKTLSGYYICPPSVRGCHDPTHYYCPSWGCETIAYGLSTTPKDKDPYLTLKYGNRWDRVTLSVKDPNSDQWFTGRTWGIRLYMTDSSSAVRPPVLRAPDKGLASLVPSSSPASPSDPFLAGRPRQPNRATPVRPTPHLLPDRPLVPSLTAPSSKAGLTPRPQPDPTATDRASRSSWRPTWGQSNPTTAPLRG
ncbi:uncharacterized protein [Dasypus novemcinctus]|uniref:uncharacterized protein n=1 Tax=Dasypus novemcinctus TaxID=9361 RepID=UPI0039C90094